jgi:hypothetical protein
MSRRRRLRTTLHLGAATPSDATQINIPGETLLRYCASVRIASHLIHHLMTGEEPHLAGISSPCSYLSFARYLFTN